MIEAGLLKVKKVSENKLHIKVKIYRDWNYTNVVCMC